MKDVDLRLRRIKIWVSSSVVIVGGLVFLLVKTNENKFIQGTTINGVDVSLMDRDLAFEVINSSLVKNYKLTIEFKDGSTEELQGDQLGLNILDYENCVAQGLLGYFNENVKLDFDVTVDVNENSVRIAILSLPEFKESNFIYPKSATIIYDNNLKSFKISEEAEGTSINFDKAFSKIITAINERQTSVSLADCYDKPEITSKDLESKLVELNNILDSEVYYNFNGFIIRVSREQLKSWIDTDELNIDISKIGKWLSGFVDYYDKPRNNLILNTLGEYGETISRNGSEPTDGNLVYELDVESEANELAKLLKNGGTIVRNPILIVKASE